MLRQLFAWVLMAFAMALAACGGGGGGATPATPTAAFVAKSQSQSLGTSGGSVTLTAADGTLFVFDVPAGALGSVTTLTLTTQAPVAGQQFNLLLQPAGLLLAGGLTGNLTITLPAGQSLPTSGAIVYDGTLIPFTRLPDGRLQISLSSFAEVAAPSALAAVRRFIGAAAGSTCANAPNLQSNGGVAALSAADIALFGRCMVGNVQDLATTSLFPQALRVVLSVTAFLQNVDPNGADRSIHEAGGLACTAYGVALNRGRNTSVTTLVQLGQIIEPIMYWVKNTQLLDATCAGIGLTDYATVIHAKIDESLAYYRQLAPSITTTTSIAFLQAKSEAIYSARSHNQILALSPPPALRATLTAEVAQRAHPAVVDAILQAPWARTRSTGNYDELIDLRAQFTNLDSLKTAAQYAGTQVSVSSFDNQNRLIGTLGPLGGTSAGQNQTNGSVPAHAQGVLTLTGPINALGCPASSLSNEELVIRFAGVVVQQISAAPYLATPLSLNLNGLRNSAGLQGSNTAPQTLTLERVGVTCNDFWGTAPNPLLSLTLNFQGDPGKITYVDNFSTYTMNADGSGKTSTGSYNYRQVATTFLPRTSADGSRSIQMHCPSISFGESGCDWRTQAVDGGGSTTLPGLVLIGTPASLSYNGNLIAFTGRDPGLNNYGPRLYNVSTQAVTPLVLQGANPQTLLSLSPDGQRIVSMSQDNNDVYRLNIFAVGGGGASIVPLTGYPSLVAWSPDGSKIAVAGGGVRVMDSGGGGMQLVAPCTTGVTDAVSWSPDGSKLVFSCNAKIYTINLNGTGQTYLADGYFPAWLPR